MVLLMSGAIIEFVFELNIVTEYLLSGGESRLISMVSLLFTVALILGGFLHIKKTVEVGMSGVEFYTNIMFLFCIAMTAILMGIRSISTESEMLTIITMDILYNSPVNIQNIYLWAERFAMGLVAYGFIPEEKRQRFENWVCGRV